jgi:hypothetical protein
VSTEEFSTSKEVLLEEIELDSILAEMSQNNHYEFLSSELRQQIYIVFFFSFFAIYFLFFFGRLRFCCRTNSLQKVALARRDPTRHSFSGARQGCAPLLKDEQVWRALQMSQC